MAERVEVPRQLEDATSIDINSCTSNLPAFVPHVKKPDGIKQLKELALAYSRTRHPELPEYARCTRNYTDKTANGLTKCIIDWLTFSGHQAERISSTGRYLDKSKVVSDVLGNSRRIGSGQWIPSSGIKGTADISATIWGKAVKIEIKIKDRQSPDQRSYQQAIEKAGGLYWICHSMEEFLNLMKMNF